MASYMGTNSVLHGSSGVLHGIQWRPTWDPTVSYMGTNGVLHGIQRCPTWEPMTSHTGTNGVQVLERKPQK